MYLSLPDFRCTRSKLARVQPRYQRVPSPRKPRYTSARHTDVHAYVKYRCDKVEKLCVPFQTRVSVSFQRREAHTSAWSAPARSGFLCRSNSVYSIALFVFVDASRAVRCLRPSSGDRPSRVLVFRTPRWSVERVSDEFGNVRVVRVVLLSQFILFPPGVTCSSSTRRFRRKLPRSILLVAPNNSPVDIVFL